MHKGNYLFSCPHWALCPEVTSWNINQVYSFPWVSDIVIIRYSQWRVFGAVTWSLRFQEFSKQMQCVGCEGLWYMHCVCCRVYTISVYVFTPPVLWVQKIVSYWACSDGFFFFGRALKHSGRLIKSVPQAAASIGSCIEKYTQSHSYITRKMRGCFEVHQSSFFFFLLAPSKKAAGVQMMELFAEEEKWKRLIWRL